MIAKDICDNNDDCWWVGIDALKGIKVENGLHRGLIETFGGKGVFQLDWLIPTNVIWIDKDDILGYTVDSPEKEEGKHSEVVIMDIEQGGRSSGEMRRGRGEERRNEWRGICILSECDMSIIYLWLKTVIFVLLNKQNTRYFQT